MESTKSGGTNSTWRIWRRSAAPSQPTSTSGRTSQTSVTASRRDLDGLPIIPLLKRHSNVRARLKSQYGREFSTTYDRWVASDSRGIDDILDAKSEAIEDWMTKDQKTNRWPGDDTSAGRFARLGDMILVMRSVDRELSRRERAEEEMEDSDEGMYADSDLPPRWRPRRQLSESTRRRRSGSTAAIATSEPGGSEVGASARDFMIVGSCLTIGWLAYKYLLASSRAD